MVSGHRSLHLADIVRNPGHQPAGGPLREECDGLPKDVAKEDVSQIMHDPLPHVGHQVARQICPDALQEIHDENSDCDRRQVLAAREYIVENRLNQRRNAR